MFGNVVGTEQIGDRVRVHRKMDPRPMVAAAAFLAVTVTALIVVMCNELPRM